MKVKFRMAVEYPEKIQQLFSGTEIICAPEVDPGGNFSYPLEIEADSSLEDISIKEKMVRGKSGFYLVKIVKKS